MAPGDRPLAWLHGEINGLRIDDEDQTWRIMYRLDADAVVIIEAFSKKTQQTPKRVVEACRRRLRAYDELVGGQHG